MDMLELVIAFLPLRRDSLSNALHLRRR